MAQLSYGAATILLRPSRFAPGGPGRMIGVRYGSLSEARAASGLADPVIDADTTTEAGTGFVSTRSTAVALLNTVAGGLTADHQPERWRVLMWRTLGADFSWQRAARPDRAVDSPVLDQARIHA